MATTILKNLINLRKILTVTQGNTSSTTNVTNFPLVDTRGNTKTTVCTYGGIFLPFTNFYTNLVTSNTSCSSSSSSSANGRNYIGFGKGTTPVTEDDYFLADIITSGISNKTYEYKVPTITEENGVVSSKQNFNGIYQNTSGASMTISEFGIFHVINHSYNSTSYPTMIYREVLDTPITVPANGYFSFNIDVEFLNKFE